MYLGSFCLVLSLQICTAVAQGSSSEPSFSYDDLPSKAIFPGPWDSYIQAPANKTYIRPKRVHSREGDVVAPDGVFAETASNYNMVLGPGGIITLDFEQNIAGRVCFVIDNVKNHPFVALTYSESPEFADRNGDATTDRLKTDLPLYFSLKNGTNCLGKDFARGGFRFLTIRLPEDPKEKDGFWHTGMSAPETNIGLIQKLLGLNSDAQSKNSTKAGVSISNLWVNCTAFPSNPNPRAYTGYFYSSSNLLNRIWYGGAYTLQLSTLDPQEGSALIDYNRNIDHNNSPEGTWYSNFTIAPGRAVTTDGAKRDRMVWPGDMSIAAPGIAMSTYDMLAIRNALDVLFAHQYLDGSLPYAGPPMGNGHEFSDTYHLHTLLGVYNYVLYSGDLNWLQMKWPAYIKALYVSINKVDNTGLIHVTSGADWLRPGMGGHNLEASSILHDVLQKSLELANFIGDSGRPDAQPSGTWQKTIQGIEGAIDKLWCGRAGLFADNIEDRNCGGSDEVLPQDGNSWALLAGVLPGSDKRNLNVSTNLKARWVAHGAPAVEYPNVISPFASSFELLAHCAAGAHDVAVELMLRMWGYMLDGPGMTNSTMNEGYRTDGYAQYPAYWSPARGSHAHGWSTGPTLTLLTEILGIKLTAPMGRRWVITPHLTGWLSFAQGGFATMLGRFEVKVKSMVDPQGRRAEVLDVRTPVDSEGTISWGGKSVDITKSQAAQNGGRFTVARLVDEPGSEWIPLSSSDAAEAEGEEEVQGQAWAMKAEGGGQFLPVKDWKEPVLDELPVGEVHWHKLEKNWIVKPPSGMLVERDVLFPGRWRGDEEL